MKRAAIILLMMVFLLVGCGTQPTEPDTDETEVVTEDVVTDSTNEQTDSNPDYYNAAIELILESNTGNVYKVTYGPISYYVTLESDMFFENTVIYDDVLVDYNGYDINRKVGEVGPSIEFGNGEEASDYFDNEKYDSSVVPQEVIVQSDFYTNSNGKTIYFSIVKSGFDDAPGRVWSYTYLVQLSDNVYAYIYLWSYQDNRSADEPRFRAIADSIVPV